MKAYIKKERSPIGKLNFYHEKLEKGKPKANRDKEIIKIRVKINTIEN